MTEIYHQLTDEHLKAFNALPVGRIIELPIGHLTPTIVDDYVASQTHGPIDAYALRHKASGLGVIWIADGNHRYYQHFRAQRTTVWIGKIIPDPDNDIRFMFGCFDEWEEF